MRKIAQLVQVLLSLPNVPVKALGQGIEPVGDLIGRANTRHRIYGGGNFQAENLSNSLLDNSPIFNRKLISNKSLFCKKICSKAWFTKNHFDIIFGLNVSK